MSGVQNGIESSESKWSLIKKGESLDSPFLLNDAAD